MERSWPILYCERDDLTLLAEPLNVASNLAFLLAAIAAASAMRRHGLSDPWIASLIALALAIFIGSSAFHARPTTLTLLMDVIPIQLFMLSLLALALRRFLALPWLGVIAGLLVFLGLVVALPLVAPDARLGMIASYLAALAALLVVGLLALRRDRETGLALIAAGAVFAGSLIARQLDVPYCPVIPIGTHWIWHLLNGTVIGILLLAAIRQASRRVTDD